MECRSCGSKWEQSKGWSRTIVTVCTVCPFCGADIGETDDSKEEIYDNSKDALAHIMRTHGADVLLGSALKNYLLDYVPMIEKRRKNVILSVSGSGAAALLKKGMSVGAEEQGRIYKQAVQKVVDDYGTDRGLVESVMLEFTEALCWKIGDPAKEEAEKKRLEEERKRREAEEQKKRQEEERKRQEAEEQKKRQEEERKRQEAEEQKKRQEEERKRQEAEEQKKRQEAEEEQKQKKGTGSIRVGQRNLQFGPYKWRVLDVQNGMVLLLAEKVLEKRKYHPFDAHITWEECDLRKYLNGKFLQRFNASEQSKIAETVNANLDNPWFGTLGGSNTRDKVFLLSIDEVVRYFGDSGKLKDRNGESKYRINDQYDTVRKTKDENNEKAWWWLRSPGSQSFDAARVGGDGNINLSGFLVDDKDGGVRPALWLVEAELERQPVRSFDTLYVGQRNVPFGSYNWCVLDVQNGRALLLAEKVLEERAYHAAYMSTTWEKCDLRKYLNGEFLQEFNEPEQSQIAEVVNVNLNNPWYGVAGGSITRDKVFLLSIDEVVKYFGDSGDLKARKGWCSRKSIWGKNKWVESKDGKGYVINDQYNNARRAEDGKEMTDWWLRSSGSIDECAAFVTKDGRLHVSGFPDFLDLGVRPALWLNL